MPRAPKATKKTTTASTEATTTPAEASPTKASPTKASPAKAAKPAKPAKEKKPRAKAAPTHPPFRIMIAKAVDAEHSRKGSTRPYIKKYLQANYGIDPASPILRRQLGALIKATTGPRLVSDHYHAGHYRLSEELKVLIGTSKRKTTKNGIDYQVIKILLIRMFFLLVSYSYS